MLTFLVVIVVVVVLVIVNIYLLGVGLVDFHENDILPFVYGEVILKSPGVSALILVLKLGSANVLPLLKLSKLKDLTN